MFKLPLIEQETIVTFNAAEDQAEIYTCYPPQIRKFDKFCEENPEEWKVKKVHTVAGKVVGKTYMGPKELISFRMSKLKREISEEKRREYSERMKKINRDRMM